MEACINTEVSSSHHMGHLMLKYMKQYSDTVGQIDAATGGEETFGSMLSRSIHLARALRQFGLKPGDVLALGGRNHLDLLVPFYAALFNGLPIVGVDPFFKYGEVTTLLKVTKPKIAFCEIESMNIYEQAATNIGLDVKLVTFTEGECTLSEFIKRYDNGGDEKDFEVAEFDVDRIYAFLIGTSGTTSFVKFAAIKHQAFIIKTLVTVNKSLKADMKGKIILNVSPVQWVTSYYFKVVAPLIGGTLVQTSTPDDFDHTLYMINKYKPAMTMVSPAFAPNLLSRKDEVDLTCFKHIDFTGAKIHPDIVLELKKYLSKDIILTGAYAQTESVGAVIAPSQNFKSPLGSCGRLIPGYDIKLVDHETGLEINEPHVPGELWVKGILFSEYYQDPVTTAKAFSKDGYYKTGDMLYRDENDNYFYVERIKSLIKYRNLHVLPFEIETVIGQHPGVQEACVVGVPHPEDSERPAACVVRKPGCDVTAQQIHDLVAEKLSKNKQLRGGVVFVDSIPRTSTGKVIRKKVLELIENGNEE